MMSSRISPRAGGRIGRGPTQSQFETISDNGNGAWGILSPAGVAALECRRPQRHEPTRPAIFRSASTNRTPPLQYRHRDTAALDGGAGYTYLNEQTGYEFSAVAGTDFTNFISIRPTQYQKRQSMCISIGGRSRFSDQGSSRSAWWATFYSQASCGWAGPETEWVASNRALPAAAGQIGYTVSHGRPRGECEH